MKPILEIKNISKKFRIAHETKPYLNIRDSLANVFKRQSQTTEDFWALKDVSFDLNPGDSVGIIGKNGAGKSTLLKILSKITPPTEGRIISKGRIASLLEVGTGFHPELSGRENIYLNGSILGMKRAEINRQFDSIIDFSGVEKFLDTPLKHYSSGMQLRLAFAVAAFLEPEILVIDEVLAVGDTEFQKKCMGKMEDISRSGRTILFVSHNMSAVRELCTKSVLLKQGMVEMYDSTEKIISAYISQNQAKAVKPGHGKENNAVYLSDIHAHGRADDLNAQLHPDQDCFFTLEIQAAQKVSNVQIGIGINDKMNNRVVTFFTKHFGLSFSLEQGLNRISCKVANLPLKPDLYNIHIFIGTDFEVYDYSHDVMAMEVVPASFYYKEIPDHSQGSMIIKQQWNKL